MTDTSTTPDPSHVPDDPPRGCVLPDDHDGDCAAGDGRTWPGPHPGPAPDTAGSGSTLPGDGTGAGDTLDPAQAKFGPRWRPAPEDLHRLILIPEPQSAERVLIDDNGDVWRWQDGAWRCAGAAFFDEEQLGDTAGPLREAWLSHQTPDQPKQATEPAPEPEPSNSEPEYELVELNSARGPGWMEANCDCGWVSFGGLESVVVESWREHVATAHAQPSNSAAGWDRDVITGLIAHTNAAGGTETAAHLEALLADGEQLRAGRSGPASSGGLDLDAIERMAGGDEPTTILATRTVELVARVRQLEAELGHQVRAAGQCSAWADALETVRDDLTEQRDQARAEAKQARAERDEACAELATERRNGAADLIDRFEAEVRRMGLDPDGPDDSLGYVRSLRLLIHLNRTSDTTEETDHA